MNLELDDKEVEVLQDVIAFYLESLSQLDVINNPGLKAKISIVEGIGRRIGMEEDDEE